MEQSTLPQPDGNWFQLFWLTVILPFFAFIKKSVRDWFADRFKPKETMSRAELESRFKDFGDKLDAHSAQSRIDNRELKAELKSDIHDLRQDHKETARDMFQKIDDFILTVLSVRRDK